MSMRIRITNVPQVDPRHGLVEGGEYDAWPVTEGAGSVFIIGHMSHHVHLYAHEYEEIGNEGNRPPGIKEAMERLRPQQAVVPYADKAMFEAAPIEVVEPMVFLLWMTPDPLGAIAAACRMYEGKPTYRLSDVTDDERRHYGEQVQKTHLQAPLEFVKFHFFIEGVDRGFTHQAVRQRTAVFAQESLRFAVKHNLAQESVVPPSILTATPTSDVGRVFHETLEKIQDAYNYLVANGIPAEDARALLPHCVATRLHYCTDLRNLVEHSGNRLCTQAQFHWRDVFLGIRNAIAEQAPELTALNLLKPICYQLGHCGFKATFDRGCTIRSRVDEFEQRGIASYAWAGDPEFDNTVMAQDGTPLPGILDSEWLDNPRAGWVR